MKPSIKARRSLRREARRAERRANTRDTKTSCDVVFRFDEDIEACCELGHGGKHRGTPGKAEVRWEE